MIMANIVIGCLWLSLLEPAQTPLEEGHPFLALDAQYQAEWQKLGSFSKEERKAFHERWLARFQDAVRQYSEGPVASMARDRMIALLSDQGRFRECLALREAKLAEVRSSAELREDPLLASGVLASYLSITATTAMYAAAEDLKNLDVDLGRKAVEYYREARALYGEKRVADYIWTLNSEADVQSMVLDDHATAAELYMQAYALLPKVSEEEMRQHPDYDAEGTLSRAAVEYARAGKPERALEVFKILAQVPEKKLSRTVYLDEMMSCETVENCNVICPFAEKWIVEHPDNSGVPSLTNNLAYCLARSKRPERAIVWFERTLENIEMSRLALPDIGLRSLYRTLAEQYSKVGNAARAAEMRERLKKLEEKKGE